MMEEGGRNVPRLASRKLDDLMEARGGGKDHNNSEHEDEDKDVITLKVI